VIDLMWSSCFDRYKNKIKIKIVALKKIQYNTLKKKIKIIIYWIKSDQIRLTCKICDSCHEIMITS